MKRLLLQRAINLISHYSCTITNSFTSFFYLYVEKFDHFVFLVSEKKSMSFRDNQLLINSEV